METMQTGAVRSSEYTKTVDSQFPPRYDLLPIEGLRRWAEAFGEGTIKYGDGNFRKGMTDSVLTQHALAHLFLYTAGDRTEDHLGHAMWNIGLLCKMEKERPELLTLNKQIAVEYEARERPIYATDDIRLQPPQNSKGVNMGAPETREQAIERVMKTAYETFRSYATTHFQKGNLDKSEANNRIADQIASVFFQNEKAS